MPSSFHSTAAGPVRSRASADGRRGLGQHRLDRSPDLQAELLQRKGSVDPGDRIAWATGPGAPRSMTARRTSTSGSPAARAARRRPATPTHPAEGHRGRARTGSACSSAVAAAEQAHRPADGVRRRSLRRPRPEMVSNAASTSCTVRDGSAAGAGRSRSDRPADPGAPLPQLAGQKGDRRQDFIGLGVAQHLRHELDLAKSRGRRGELGGRRGQDGEQHQPSALCRTTVGVDAGR